MRLLESVYGMTNSGKLSADKLTEWLLEAGFVQYQCHMSIYYKYAQYGKMMFYLMLMNVYIGILMKLL